MPSLNETSAAITGAVLLARGERAGMASFDLSVEGFWRSFAAYLLVAPGYALFMLGHFQLVGWPGPPLRVFTSEALAFLLGVAVFPLAALSLTWALGLGRRFVPLVVALNWAGVPQIALSLAALLLGSLLPPLRLFLLLSAMLLTLVYQWFVIATALETHGGVAALFVMMGITIDVFCSQAMDQLLL